MCPSKHKAMCPSKHEAGIKLELKENYSSLTLPTSSETYPYPKGEHNGAVGPKYASFQNVSFFKKNLGLSRNTSQCPRTDLNKRFLPRPKTITA